MKRLSVRPSPAMVVACLALFVAIGGVSYAAVSLPKNSVGTKQIKAKAVTQAKLSPSAVKALSGKQGPVGPAGADGVKGDTGAAGATGTTGAAGAKGATGDAGPKGATGDAGPKGATGDAGPKGTTGDAGPKGTTGDAGPIGPSNAYGYHPGGGTTLLATQQTQVASVSLSAGSYAINAALRVQGGATAEAPLCTLYGGPTGTTFLDSGQVSVTPSNYSSLTLLGEFTSASAATVKITCFSYYLGSSVFPSIQAIKVGSVSSL